VAISVTSPGTATGAPIPAAEVVVGVSFVAGSVTSQGIARAEETSAVEAAEEAAEAALALGVEDLDTWRGIAPRRKASVLVVVVAVAVVFGVGRLVIWLGIAALKEEGLAVVTVVAAAAVVLGRAPALIAGSLGILRGSVWRLPGEVKGYVLRREKKVE